MGAVGNMNLAGVVLFSYLILLAQEVSCQAVDEASVVVSGNEEDGQVLNFQDKGEDVDKELAKLNVDNKDEITAEESYRCGVFYAGAIGAKPIKALYVVPKRFKFDCDRPEEELIESAKQECIALFENLGKAVNWETSSRLRTGDFNFGDDICHHLKHRSGIKRLPPSKRFKKGVPIGYYSNFCGKKEWFDTERRSPDNICCNREDPWKYFGCPKYLRTNKKNDDKQK